MAKSATIAKSDRPQYLIHHTGSHQHWLNLSRVLLDRKSLQGGVCQGFVAFPSIKIQRESPEAISHLHIEASRLRDIYIYIASRYLLRKDFLGKVRLNPIPLHISESLPDSSFLIWVGRGCLWMFGV